MKCPLVAICGFLTAPVGATNPTLFKGKCVSVKWRNHDPGGGQGKWFRNTGGGASLQQEEKVPVPCSWKKGGSRVFKVVDLGPISSLFLVKQEVKISS